MSSFHILFKQILHVHVYNFTDISYKRETELYSETNTDVTLKQSKGSNRYT